MRQRSMGARSATDTVGYREMRAFAKRFPDRMWAIEGCNGIGRHRAASTTPVAGDSPRLPPGAFFARGLVARGGQSCCAVELIVVGLLRR
jgi:transposase